MQMKHRAESVPALGVSGEAFLVGTVEADGEGRTSLSPCNKNQADRSLQ